MKKMKSLKQQMTAYSLTLVVMAIAVCAPEQASAQQRMRRSASANARQLSNAGGNYSYNIGPNVQDRRYGTGGGRGVPPKSLSLNFEEWRHRGVNFNKDRVAKPNNVSINWGDGTIGSANVQRQNNANPQVNKPRRFRAEIIGSTEYFNSYSKPKNIWLPGTYGKGSFAKASGKQDH